MAGKVHAFEDVQKHNKKDDCWLIIFGKVYNVTPFLEDHPGGDEVLLTATGKDATTDFEDIGHSSYAQEKMNEFYIGDIDTSTIPLQQHYTPQTASATHNRDSSDSFKIILYILPLFIIGVAFFLRFYTKQD